jgi:DNA-binding PadR family transcriptional regulator
LPIKVTVNFDDIERYFREPHVVHLNPELAVCYILHTLLENDTYGSELVQRLALSSESYRLSDTVLYGALSFLEHSGAVLVYWQKAIGRGRPRRMYSLVPGWRDRAQQLAQYWQRQEIATQATVRELVPLN